MSSQCTNIENIKNKTGLSSNSAHINETNVSTAQQILQKFNELEAGDNDVQQQALNNDMQKRQLDPELQKQQREIELQKQYIQNQQYMNQQQNNEQVNKPVQKKDGIIDKIMNLINSSQDKLKYVVIITCLYVGLNLEVTNNLIKKYISFVVNEHNEINMNGIILKGVILGLLYYIMNIVLQLI